MDTSGFLHGWKRHYPPDIFPTLWKNIEDLIEEEILISSEEVYKELEVGGDDLYNWASKYPNLFVSSSDLDVQNQLIRILSNPEHSKLIPPNTTSKTIADPYVIAVAKVKGCTVISAEEFQTSPSPKKTKIPNVCRDLGIPHMSFIEFIRIQSWKY